MKKKKKKNEKNEKKALFSLKLQYFQVLGDKKEEGPPARPGATCPAGGHCGAFLQTCHRITEHLQSRENGNLFRT